MPTTQIVSTSMLDENPWNPNVVDPINYEKLKTSIQKDGLVKPIVVRELDGRFQILDGAHRFLVHKELGIEDVEVKNFGEISEAAAKKITLLGNSRYGEDDTDKMALLLESDIEDAESLLATLPIDEHDLENFFAHESLDLSELDDLADEDDAEHGLSLDTSSTSPLKTHQILRFKVSVEDAEALAEKISTVKAQQGFTESDDLTNAGDALSYLLLGGAK